MCEINEFCCCCYLSTGIVFVCCFYLVWFGIFYNISKPPIFADYIDGTNNVFNRLNSDHYSWYYFIGIAVALTALLGVFTKKRILLLPLIWFDILSSVFTVIVCTMFYVGNWEKNESGPHPSNLNLLLYSAWEIYVISLEVSFYKELKKNRYGNGVVLNRPEVSICRPTAPHVVEIAPEQCHFFNPASSAVPQEYNAQDPYNYQPYPQVYSQAPVVQQSNLLDNSTTQFNTPPFPHGAPPPYPYVQGQNRRENPPPYAP